MYPLHRVDVRMEIMTVKCQAPQTEKGAINGPSSEAFILDVMVTLAGFPSSPRPG